MGPLVRALHDVGPHAREGRGGHRGSGGPGQGQRRREPPYRRGLPGAVDPRRLRHPRRPGRRPVHRSPARGPGHRLRATPGPGSHEADNLVAAGDEASLRQALELEPDHQGATEGLARLLIDRGEAPDALALLARLPETDTGRTLAAEARLLEAGVDVSNSDHAEIEAKLDELLDKVRDDDAARQEFVDLLAAMGAEDPRTNEYRRALAARLF